MNGLFFSAHYESSALPPLSLSPLYDLSEVEGWEKESERNTLRSRRKKKPLERQSSSACGFVGAVHGGS